MLPTYGVPTCDSSHVFRSSEGDSGLLFGGGGGGGYGGPSPHEGTSECWDWLAWGLITLLSYFISLDCGVEGKSLSSLAFCVLSTFGGNIIRIYLLVGYAMIGHRAPSHQIHKLLDRLTFLLL